MQTANLKEKYLKEIRPKLKTSLGKENTLEVPALEKITINTGFGKMAPDQKTTEQIKENLAKITGQTAQFTRAKKAISAFKIREGQNIGAKVTLRGDKMYHFFLKLVSVVLPRLRDFRGVSETAFDGQGNYTLGFKEINVFPEVEYARGEKPIGIEVTVSTTAETNEEAKALLEEMGMPFRKQEQSARQEVKV